MLTMIADTSAGTRTEHRFPQGICIADVNRARVLVEREHMKLGHHLESNGTPRGDVFFAGFTRSCVPQSEARALLERCAAEVPKPVLDLITGGGIDQMMMLYAVTLQRATSPKRLKGGVYLEETIEPIKL